VTSTRQVFAASAIAASSTGDSVRRFTRRAPIPCAARAAHASAAYGTSIPAASTAMSFPSVSVSALPSTNGACASDDGRAL
jgi:hypothetical protein